MFICCQQADDIAIYGMGIGRKEHWPLWLLVLAMIAGLAASAQQRSLRSYGLSGRIFLGFVAGGAVGGYIALELFPSQKILQLLLMSTCLLVSCAVVLVGLPASKTPVLLHTILLLWAALLPAALLLERQSPLPEMHLQRLFADTVAAVEDERRMFRFVSLLLTYAVQSTLLAFCFKLKISRGLDRPLTGSSQSPIKNSVQLGFASKLGGFLGSCWTSSGTSMGAYHRAAAKAGSGYHGLRMEGLGWLPTAGNLITVLCFMLCVTLEMVWFKGGELVLLPLCSLLLLLSQDRLIFPQLNHRRRYFPPILAATSHLALTSCNEVMQIAHLHADATGQSPFVVSVWGWLESLHFSASE